MRGERARVERRTAQMRAEFERASTTVLNAFLTPVITRYLGSLSERLVDRELELTFDELLAPTTNIEDVFGQRLGEDATVTFDVESSPPLSPCAGPIRRSDSPL